MSEVPLDNPEIHPLADGEERNFPQQMYRQGTYSIEAHRDKRNSSITLRSKQPLDDLYQKAATFPEPEQEQYEDWRAVYLAVSSMGKIYEPQEVEEGDEKEYMMRVVSNYNSPEDFSHYVLEPLARVGAISQAVVNSFTSEAPRETQAAQPHRDIPAWQEAHTPQEVIAAIRAENAGTNGNVMMELTSQRTGETYWFNPVRVSDELEHPEQYPTANNGLKFREDIEENGLRITQVVPLELDQSSSMPETLKRQMAIRTFARTRGYDVSGAYEGHYIQRKKPNQS